MPSSLSPLPTSPSSSARCAARPSSTDRNTMAPNRRRRAHASTSGHRYPRSARVGETLREIIADELVRIDDERLAFVTITSIDVDNELNRAVVYFDSLAGDEGDDQIIETLESHRR